MIIEKIIVILLIILTILTVCAWVKMWADEVTMAPDGTFVDGTPQICPDGTYVGGGEPNDGKTKENWNENWQENWE